jgi:hypothetical protein
VEGLARPLPIHRSTVARYPPAGFFCRECVTENAGRLVCAACQRAASAPAPGSRRRLEIPGLVLQASLGLTLLWLLFYGAGRLLILLPSSFHEGTLWGGK